MLLLTFSANESGLRNYYGSVLGREMKKEIVLFKYAAAAILLLSVIIGAIFVNDNYRYLMVYYYGIEARLGIEYDVKAVEYQVNQLKEEGKLVTKDYSNLTLSGEDLFKNHLELGEVSYFSCTYTTGADAISVTLAPDDIKAMDSLISRFQTTEALN